MNGGGDGMDGGGEEGGGARNHSCILLGSLRLLSRRDLERIVGERTMEGLEGRTEGKGIARGIVVVEREEDSFRGKLSCKRIGESFGGTGRYQ